MSDNNILSQAELNGMTLLQVHLLLNDMMDRLIEADIVGCGILIKQASRNIDKRIKNFRESKEQNT